MTHVKRFHGIPMSKSMRGICKEEDYAFLATPKETTGKTTERTIPQEQKTLDSSLSTTVSEDPGKEKKEERLRRRMEREQQEKERLDEIEEKKKEKEQRWRSRVAELASTHEKNHRERLERLRRFREFQRKVLAEEAGTEAVHCTADQLLTRM